MIYPQHKLMKKISLFLSLLSLPFIGFSQGGNTCANAMGSPIAIPFSSTTGSTCAATTTDDYNMVGASCMDPLNTQGADWLYYVCRQSNLNFSLRSVFC